MNTKITIITINRNDLDGLKKTISSVREQTCKLDHIVIDGDSTDGSKAYLESISDTLSYWISEPDCGVYDAMNKGIAAATGDYLLFLNAGDHFYKTKALQMAILHLGQEDLVYFDMEVVEKDNRFIKKYPDQLSFSFFVRDTLPHPATFVRRSAFAKANQYNIHYNIVSDWKFFMDALCKRNLTYKYVSEVLSTFYIGGLSSRPENYAAKSRERSEILNNEYHLFLKDTEDIVIYKEQVDTLKRSRIIGTLIKLGFLNRIE